MLSSHQSKILQSLVNRLIPADDDPGGWDGGVGNYLLRQFEGDLKSLTPMYGLGLDALDAEAQAVYGAAFDQLTDEQQDALLTQIEIGSVATVWPIDPVQFFRMAVDHAAEGYYADPGNGGNTGGVSWAMIGFEVRG